MPVIDISLPSHVIKQNLAKYLWNHFTGNFILTNLVHTTTTSVNATNVQDSQSHPTSITVEDAVLIAQSIV